MKVFDMMVDYLTCIPSILSGYSLWLNDLDLKCSCLSGFCFGS